jgi:hypothetical protein
MRVKYVKNLWMLFGDDDGGKSENLLVCEGKNKKNLVICFVGIKVKKNPFQEKTRVYQFLLSGENAWREKPLQAICLMPSLQLASMLL